jgi:hypothetical protein
VRFVVSHTAPGAGEQQTSLDEGDVIGWVMGFAAARGVDLARVVDVRVSGRHRRIHLLRLAQDHGLFVYLGIEDIQDDHEG